jgi:TP901 family phage tail tape measure protein
MSSTYTILVEAKIDPTSANIIQTNLDTISNNVTFNITKIDASGAIASLKTEIETALNSIKINSANLGSAIGAGQAGGVSGGGGATNPAGIYRSTGIGNGTDEDAFIARGNELIAQRVAITKEVLHYQQSEADQLDKLTSATRTYNDLQGNIITETYGWVEAENQAADADEIEYEWKLKSGTATRDLVKNQNVGIQQTKQETQTIRTLNAAYAELNQSKQNIANLSVGGVGIVDPAALENAQVATQNYEKTLEEVKSHGSIISPEDNQNLVNAKQNMDRMNVALEQEAVNLKNTVQTRLKDEAAVEKQLQNAQRTIDSNNALMRNKSANNVLVKDAAKANQELETVMKEVQETTKTTTAVTDKQSNALKDAQINAKNAGAALSAAGKDANSWVHEVDIAIKRTIEWAGAMTLIYGAKRQLEQGVQFIKDLNKELVNIQLVTGITSKDVTVMSQGFADLAKQLGSTTKEVAQGSLEWYRQGKTAEETTALLRNSTMMAKLANLDAAQSTEYMTSIMNGFNLEVKDMSSVLDKLVALDNNYATSVGEIADAMQRSSNSANQAGVSLTELASYITVISSTTRKSAESIGESLKTMFARFADIKTGALDDTGQSINNVEAALKRVNIEIRDSPTSFKALDVVIGELGAKWSTLNEIEQDNIAKAVAGVRQRENFLVLMNNYGKVLEAEKVALDSNGLAAQRYTIYMQGLEAATNKFTVAWEEMWMKSLDTKVIKGFIDFGTALLNVVGDVKIFNLAIIAMSAFMGSKLMVFIPGITSAIDSLAVSMGVATVATEGLSFALTGGLIGVALVAAEFAFAKLNETIVNTYDNFEKLKKVSDDNQTELRDLAKEYLDLSQKQNKTAEDITRLLDIQTILNTKYGAAKDGVNAYSAAIDGNTAAIRENYNWILKQADFDAKSFLDKNKYAYEEAQKYLKTPGLDSGRNMMLFGKTPEEQLKILDQQIAKGQDIFGALRSQRDMIQEQVTAAQKLIIETEHYKNVLNTATGQNGQNGGDVGVGAASRRAETQAGSDFLDAGMQQAQMEATIAENAANAATQIEALGKEFDTLNGTLQSNVSMMDSINKSYHDNATLTLEQVDQIKKAFPKEYTDIISVQGDRIRYNKDVLKQLIQAEADHAVSLAYEALQLDKGNKELQLRYDLAVAYSKQIARGETADNAADIKKAADEKKKAYDDLLKDTIDMIKQQVNDQKDAYQEDLKNYKDAIDAKKQALQDQADNAKQALQDQLDSYKAIIDAEKRLIDLRQAAADQADAVANKNKEISDIDAQLLAMQFDNSEAGKAKKLQLEAEKVAKTKELTKIQNDYSVTNQKDALDQEYNQFEKENKNKQKAIDATLKVQLKALDADYKAYEANVNAKIKALDRYLKDTGKITADAMALIAGKTKSFYDQLLQWNRTFGTSVDRDIIDKWNQAIGAIDAYVAAAIQAQSFVGSLGSWSDPSNSANNNPTGTITDPGTGSTYNTPVKSYHSGVFSVGDLKLAENEEFAKLLDGEAVVRPDTISKFMHSVLPNLITNNNQSSIGDINIPITIQGNVDKDVMTSLKSTILDTVNIALKDRGVRRGAFSYSL